MKRFTFLALLFTALLSSNAQADFAIDNFLILDDVGGGPTSIRPIGTNPVTVEVTDNTGTTTATVSDDLNDGYLFTANNIGDSFEVSYDWAGVFDDLASISGTKLSGVPANFFGDWTMTVDTGVGAPVAFGPTVPSILSTPIELDSATELTFNFTYNGSSPLGFGVGTFGGLSGPLFATPEPTAFMMLGTAGLIVLFPRRRRS